MLPDCYPLGEKALTLEFGRQIDPALNLRVLALARMLETRPFQGFTECQPAYASLTVHYDPLVVLAHRSDKPAYEQVRDYVLGLLSLSNSVPGTGKSFEVPVLYGGTAGPDLAAVARMTGLSESEVVRLHCLNTYRVYMVGFLPGFPYLGTLPDALEVPRKQRPESRVQAGSVGLAGLQTGIYPMESPGGWQIIGRTPVRIFDPGSNPPVLFSPGDRVRFFSISERDFRHKQWRLWDC